MGIKSVKKITSAEAQVEVINSIKDKHKDLRQASKAPTFALTYNGTWSTLVRNCGFTEDEAKQIEHNYHSLYKVSDQWVKNRLKQAELDGYVEVAFGLRVRTPMIAQSILGCSATPTEVEAEGRTAANAMGQSYGLLNSRAGSEFLGQVRKSRYRLDIRPVAQIHDAQYYLVRDNMETFQYLNKHLVDATRWQDDPAIYHPDVHLFGEVSIFHPSWAHELTIPNEASEEEVKNLCLDHIKEDED